MTDPFDRPGTARPLVPQIAAMPEHAKLITYLEQENSVLHSKLRSLEMKLEKAEKALAVEREACAKVAEDFSAGMTDWWSGVEDDGSKVQSDASIGAAKIIAQLIRGRQTHDNGR
jgi:hypothetical protein